MLTLCAFLHPLEGEHALRRPNGLPMSTEHAAQSCSTIQRHQPDATAKIGRELSPRCQS